MSVPYYDPNEDPQDPGTPSAPEDPQPPRSFSEDSTLHWPDPAPRSAARPEETGTEYYPDHPASQPSYSGFDGSLEPEEVPRPPGGMAAAGNDRIRIALWGAPRSGKTSYLAAMPIAAMQQQRQGRPNWVISGMNPESNEFLTSGVTQLASDRVFPEATVGVRSLSWSFQGEETANASFRKRRDVGFVLEVQDVAGEVYGRDVEHALRPRVLDQLTRSQGLIYLFDPLLDGEQSTNSFDFLYSMLNELNTRVRNAGRLHRNRLPHHVSVCVTKFDDPKVFRPAVEAGWVTQDSVGSRLPRVPAEQAAHYFQWLCDEFRGSNARLVRDGLLNFFHPQRISYYVSSAIGFRLNPQHIFDYRNYLNVETVDHVPRIRTSPVPINVLEPLTELESRIRTAARRRRPW